MIFLPFFTNHTIEHQQRTGTTGHEGSHGSGRPKDPILQMRAKQVFSLRFNAFMYLYPALSSDSKLLILQQEVVRTQNILIQRQDKVKIEIKNTEINLLKQFTFPQMPFKIK